MIVKISTDGKFLIVGKLNFADDNISHERQGSTPTCPGSRAGDVVVLFLADIPDQVRLLTIHGKLKMGFRNPSGEDVEFDVLDETTSGTPTSTKPTATIIDPIGADGSIDVSRIVGQNYVDVAFQAPGGALLDYASILDSTGVGASELTLTRGTTSLGTLGPKPTPITTLTTGIGVALVPLVYDAATESVYRFAAERTVVTGTLTACKANANNWDCREETQDLGAGPVTVVTAHTAKVTVVTKTADLPGGAADLETALLDLAIRKTGTNRFRYQFTATPAWVPGTVTVDFAARQLQERRRHRRGRKPDRRHGKRRDLARVPRGGRDCERHRPGCRRLCRRERAERPQLARRALPGSHRLRDRLRAPSSTPAPSSRSPARALGRSRSTPRGRRSSSA